MLGSTWYLVYVTALALLQSSSHLQKLGLPRELLRGRGGRATRVKPEWFATLLEK